MSCHVSGRGTRSSNIGPKPEGRNCKDLNSSNGSISNSDEAENEALRVKTEI